MKRWVRSAGALAAGLLVLVGLFATRVVREGEAELASGQAARAAGDVAGATTHARRAAMAYLPGAPHVATAYRLLRDIALESEARGDIESALFAWRSVRAAALESRSLVTPRVGEREVADAAIGRLSATSGRKGPTLVVEGLVSVSEGEAALARAHESPPRVLFGGLLVMGAALWFASLARLLGQGWDGAGRLDRAEVKRVAVLAGAGLLAWCVGLLGA